ncbi:MAG: hypothetical protein WCJ30_11590, partial [Deltaproteobacteria bacterium]
MTRGLTQSARWVLVVVAVLATPLAFAQTRAGRGGAAGSASSAPPAAPTPGVAAVGPDVCIPPDRTAAATACPAGSVHFGSHAATAPPAAARATADARDHAKAAKKAGAIV